MDELGIPGFEPFVECLCGLVLALPTPEQPTECGYCHSRLGRRARARARDELNPN